MKGIAVLLLLWLIAAMAIKNWADYWGRPSLPYFLTSLFLTPLVPTLVLLLQGKEQSLFEQSLIAKGRLKRCPQCAEAIRFDAYRCKFCGSQQISS